METQSEEISQIGKLSMENFTLENIRSLATRQNIMVLILIIIFSISVLVYKYKDLLLSKFNIQSETEDTNNEDD